MVVVVTIELGENEPGPVMLTVTMLLAEVAVFPAWSNAVTVSAVLVWAFALRLATPAVTFKLLAVAATVLTVNVPRVGLATTPFPFVDSNAEVEIITFCPTFAALEIILKVPVPLVMFSVAVVPELVVTGSIIAILLVSGTDTVTVPLKPGTTFPFASTALTVIALYAVAELLAGIVAGEAVRVTPLVTPATVTVVVKLVAPIVA